MRYLEGSLVLLWYGLKENRGVPETVQRLRRVLDLPVLLVIRLWEGGLAVIGWWWFQVGHLVQIV